MASWMEPCAFTSKYEHPLELEDRVISFKGASTQIEMWRNTASEEWVAAKLVSGPSALVAPEIRALVLANNYAVPRVVKIIEQIPAALDSSVIILGLVKGVTVQQYLNPTHGSEGRKREGKMLTTATQLLETVTDLHATVHLAHLDISCDNVILQPGACLWDSVRLVGFSSAQKCSPDLDEFIDPRDASASTAAPEVLRALIPTMLPGICHTVNGPAADIWSTGVVLYHMLTRESPFQPTPMGCSQSDGATAADTRTLECERMIGAQQSWCCAVEEASRLGQPVRHTIIDKIRACSSTPNDAVDFFTHMLHPDPHRRFSATAALHQPYLAKCLHFMTTGQPPADSSHAQGHRRRSHIPVRLGNRLRLPQAVGLLKGVTGSIVSPLARPFTHRRPASTPLLDPSAIFPPYTHTGEDHALPAAGWFSQMHVVNVPMVSPRRALDVPVYPGQAVADMLLSFDIRNELRGALESAKKPISEWSAADRDSTSWLRQDRSKGPLSTFVQPAGAQPSSQHQNRRKPFAMPHCSSSFWVPSDCQIEEVDLPSPPPQEAASAPPEPSFSPAGAPPAAVLVVDNTDDPFADRQGRAPEPAGPSEEPLLTPASPSADPLPVPASPSAEGTAEIGRGSAEPMLAPAGSYTEAFSVSAADSQPAAPVANSPVSRCMDPQQVHDPDSAAPHTHQSSPHAHTHSDKSGGGGGGWWGRSRGALGSLAKGYAIGGALLGAGYLIVSACNK